jgi:hypothetical protein
MGEEGGGRNQSENKDTVKKEGYVYIHIQGVIKKSLAPDDYNTEGYK